MMKAFFTLPLIILCFFTAVSSDFDDRRNEFINGAINGNSLEGAILKAYRDVPINQSVIDEALESVIEERHLDFKLIKLIRIMFLTEGEFDQQILTALEPIPFWLPDADNLREYWSENHMIMWMSANWLLHEKHDWEARPTLRQNVVHYLNLKNEYGFYEYFSPVYAQFTIAALMNLADFSEDEEIKAKATSAVQRLLSELLLFANDRGVYYPVAGRGYPGQYTGPGKYKRSIYLLTGRGELSGGAGNASVSIATSSVDFSEVISSWKEEENFTLHLGHTIFEGKRINSELSREDKIIFQWSSGGYFHPATANDMIWQLGNYNMWDHRQFRAYKKFKWLPPNFGHLAANFTKSISKSSYIGEAEINIFKNKGIVLSSNSSLLKGHAGYQQWPWVATVETEPIWTKSGNVGEGSVGNGRSNNTSLPYIDQNENVALIMYRPNWDLPIFGIDDFNIWLYYQTEKFDEVNEFDNWVVGKLDDSYVAVKKHCDGIINDYMACDDQDGQTWAIVVGNEEMHQSFDNFNEIISEATYEERWYFKWQTFSWIYYGHINVDGKDIRHHWSGNVLSGPSNIGGRSGRVDESFQAETADINVFPNPAKDFININISQYEKGIHTISIINMAGQNMYYDASNTRDSFISIPTLDWTNGVYTLIIENEDGSADFKRLIIQK